MFQIIFALIAAFHLSINPGPWTLDLIPGLLEPFLSQFRLSVGENDKSL